jgi:hypothetical protein
MTMNICGIYHKPRWLQSFAWNEGWPGKRGA